jgi:hypothetical protein
MQEAIGAVHPQDSEGRVFFCPGCARFRKYADALEFYAVTMRPFFKYPEENNTTPDGWAKVVQPLMLCVNCQPY